ncbi:MAG: hypothetical protein NVV62_04195 [Terricaulis sp.]|nr:hypothetical protein [Terricaulis sp.]
MSKAKDFLMKYKFPLIIGAAIGAYLTFGDFSDPNAATPPPGYNERAYEQPAQPQNSDYQPTYAPRADSGYDSDAEMERWRQSQAREDQIQRDRIDSIREVERCYDSETGRSYEVSIHVGC